MDGGGWLLPYTGRWALVPTVFYGFSPNEAMKLQIRAWGEDAAEITTCSQEFWALVEETGADWIYIREGEGRLQMEGLSGCDSIKIKYCNETVTIFRILE
jgi:hypothetical protein